MSFKTVEVNYEGSVNGIARWISKKSKIADIHSAGLISVSTDNHNDPTGGLITAPIGYAGTKTTWWGTIGSCIGHYYMIDFLSIRINIKGYATSMQTEHYHKHIYFFGSNDTINWDIIDEVIYDSEPDDSTQYYNVKNPMTVRAIKYFVNGTRFNGGCSLAFGKFDIFGTIKWPSCATNKMKRQKM